MTTMSAARAARVRGFPQERWLSPSGASGRCAVPNHRALLATLLITVLVAACGGDGGGDGDGVAPPPPPPPTGTQVTGTASKGFLGNAIVRVYDVAANGMAGTTPLATTRTEALGTFRFNVNATGPIVLTVTTDDQSTMIDELVGGEVSAPVGLVLRAALPGVTTTPVAITPLTDMAYQLAIQSPGGLTVANIDAANSAVSAAMLDGAPIVSTLPVSLWTYRTASVAEQAQAKLLTALSAAAAEGIAVGREGVACNSSEYNGNLACLVDGLGALLVPGASDTLTFAPEAAYIVEAYDRINSGLVTVDGGKSAQSIGLAAVTAAERSLVEAVTSEAVLFGYDPSASPLQNTKALFADLRTNVVQLRAGTDVFGVTPLAAALREDFTTNVAPVLTGTRSVLVAVYGALDLLQDPVPGTVEYVSSSVVCGYDPAGFGTAANAALCRYGTGYDSQILLTVTAGAPGTFGVTTQPLTYVDGGTSWNGILDLGYARYVRNAAHGPLAANVTLTAVGTGQSASWDGPFYVTAAGGQVTAGLVAEQSDDWDADTLSGTIDVAGLLSDGGGGIALQEAVVGTGSQVVVRNGNMTGDEPSSLSGALLARFTTSSYEYLARADIGDSLLDASGTIGLPQTVSVTGSVASIGTDPDQTPAPLFEGRIELGLQGIGQFDATAELSHENMLVLQAQVSGQLTLPDSRTLLVSVAANVTQLPPMPDAPHSFSATYAYTTPAGMARINVSGTYDEIAGYSAIVTTNAGVSATITRSMSGTVSGAVMANGVQTATISGMTINYSDGSTESLF